MPPDHTFSPHLAYRRFTLAEGLTAPAWSKGFGIPINHQEAKAPNALPTQHAERPHDLADSPRITVAVPCLNEAPTIGTVMEQLLTQTLTRGTLSIVVCDGGSTDGSAEIVASYAHRHKQITLLHNAARVAGAARNLAVRAHDFDVFIVVDAHCTIPDDHYIDHVLDALDESRAFCLSRPQPIRVAGVSLWQRASAAVRASWLGHCPGSLIYHTGLRGFVSPISAAQVYRREVFERVGLFSEGFASCEDLEFNVRVERAGLATFHCPEIALEYHARGSLRSLFHHMFRYGRGRIHVAALHPRSMVRNTAFLPALFVLWVALGHLLEAPVGNLHGLSVALYCLVLLTTSAGIGLRHGFAVGSIAPLLFLTIHFGWGFGQIVGATSLLVAPQSGHTPVAENCTD